MFVEPGDRGEDLSPEGFVVLVSDLPAPDEAVEIANRAGHAFQALWDLDYRQALIEQHLRWHVEEPRIEADCLYVVTVGELA